MSGVRLAKTLGTAAHSAARFADTSADLVGLELRSQLAGRWRMATMQASSSPYPRPRLPRGGLPGHVRRDDDRHARRVHGAAGRHLPAAHGAAQRHRAVGGVDGALLRGSSSTSTSPRGRRRRAPGAARPGPGRGARPARRRDGALPGERPDAVADVSLAVPAGSTLALVGATGLREVHAGRPARPAPRPRHRARVSGRHRRARPRPGRARRGRRHGVAGELPGPRLGAREPPPRAPGATDAELVAGPRGRPGRRPRRHPPRRARHRRRSPRAPVLRRRAAAARRSPAPCCATRPYSSSTRPRAPSTPPPSGSCRVRSTGSDRAAPPSPSPTGSRPSERADRSRSSTRAGSSSPATTTSSWPAVAGTPALVAAADGAPLPA